MTPSHTDLDRIESYFRPGSISVRSLRLPVHDLIVASSCGVHRRASFTMSCERVCVISRARTHTRMDDLNEEETDMFMELMSDPPTSSWSAGVTPRHTWTLQEDAKLLQHYYAGSSFDNIASEMGLSTGSVTGRFNQLRLKYPDVIKLRMTKEHAVVTVPKWWTAEEDDTLFESKAEGLSWPEISDKIPGRTEKACQMRWYLLQKSKQ